MFRQGLGLALAAALAFGAASPALADWHDHDIGHFRDHDLAYWRGGHWFHGYHEGRLGWWWMVGGAWYFYPAPIYPYPNPYVPPYAAPGAPAWYYCPPAQSYYPYVPTCPVPWQVVPAR